MSVMVTTMMATACVLSFLEVEGEEEVEEWDHREQDTGPPPDAQTTGLLCQVGAFYTSSLYQCISVLMNTLV